MPTYFVRRAGYPPVLIEARDAPEAALSGYHKIMRDSGVMYDKERFVRESSGPLFVVHDDAKWSVEMYVRLYGRKTK